MVSNLSLNICNQGENSCEKKLSAYCAVFTTPVIWCCQMPCQSQDTSQDSTGNWYSHKQRAHSSSLRFSIAMVLQTQWVSNESGFTDQRSNWRKGCDAGTGFTNTRKL